jgi:hypothetical protein
MGGRPDAPAARALPGPTPARAATPRPHHLIAGHEHARNQIPFSFRGCPLLPGAAGAGRGEPPRTPRPHASSAPAGGMAEAAPDGEPGMAKRAREPQKTAGDGVTAAAATLRVRRHPAQGAGDERNPTATAGMGLSQPAGAATARGGAAKRAREPRPRRICGTRRRGDEAGDLPNEPNKLLI